MTISNIPTSWKASIGTIALTLFVSIAGWMLRAYQELDRTQEVVLQRLMELESFDVDDRWKKEQELSYQEAQKDKDSEQDRRLRVLEESHIYQHNRKPINKRYK